MMLSGKILLSYQLLLHFLLLLGFLSSRWIEVAQVELFSLSEHVGVIHLDLSTICFTLFLYLDTQPISNCICQIRPENLYSGSA